MKITLLNNDRTEYKNAHNVNKVDTPETKQTETGADNVTSATVTKHSIYDWTPPPNYPPDTAERHHQHDGTKPKQPMHTRNQLPENVTLTTIAPSDTVEKIEERGMQVQSGKIPKPTQWNTHLIPSWTSIISTTGLKTNREA